MNYLRTIAFKPIHRVAGVMVQRLPSACTLRLDFFSRIDAGCADGTAVRVTVTDVRVECGVLSLFQALQLVERCVLGLLLPGWCVFGMVPPFRSGLLFVEREGLGMDFPLRLRLRFPGWYKCLGGGFAKLICLSLMTR